MRKHELLSGLALVIAAVLFRGGKEEIYDYPRKGLVVVPGTAARDTALEKQINEFFQAYGQTFAATTSTIRDLG